ncbi:MAG: hypothetical protein HQL75_12010 [Magnetococcales bacterium]|nr:hypothetical protein [Magnetococcales bacterium]
MFPKTSFVNTHFKALTEWASYIAQHEGLILAISRKGPRLLELLIQEGVLSPSVQHYIITERALPFMLEERRDLMILDDLVAHGTTFQRIRVAAKQLMTRIGKITNCPFAVCDGAMPEVQDIIDASFKVLQPSQNAGFVHEQLQALQWLGCPFDIEYPTVTYQGNFQDVTALEQTLAAFATNIGATWTSNPVSLALVDGVTVLHKWTILLADGPLPDFAEQPQFRKLRIYLSHDRQRLSMMGIAPSAMNPTRLLQDAMPDAFLPFWMPAQHVLTERMERLKNDPIQDQSVALGRDMTLRSLVTFANYLRVLGLLRLAARDLDRRLINQFGDVLFQATNIKELRYLIGPQLAEVISPAIASFFSVETDPSALHGMTERKKQDLKDVIVYPPGIDDGRKDCFQKEFAEHAAWTNGSEDVMRTLFHTQSMVLERPLRNLVGHQAHMRLDFGVSFDFLQAQVQQRHPQVSLACIHASLDRLVDDGVAVPRFMPIPNRDGTWHRLFRVGEGPTEKDCYAVRLVFKELRKALKEHADKKLEDLGRAGKTESTQVDRLKSFQSGHIPSLLFEKFCVCAFDLMADWDPRLSPFRGLKITRSFHLYGARADIIVDHNQRIFLNDWARARNLIRVASTEEKDSPMTGLVLNDNLDAIYPDDHCPWRTLGNGTLKDGLEDLAESFARFTENRDDQPSMTDLTVSITSTAKTEDYFQAIQAELDLWLHDHRVNFFRILDALAGLLMDEHRNEKEFERLNKLLAQTANFCAQARKKTELFHDRKRIVQHLRTITDEERTWKRQWRTGLDELEHAIAHGSKKHEQVKYIFDTISIAGKATSLLRDLLSSVWSGSESAAAHSGKGNKSPGGHPLLPSESLQRLIDTIEAAISSNNVLAMLINNVKVGNRQRSRYSSLLEALTRAKGSIIDSADGFKNNYTLLRPLLINLAENGQQVLRIYGSDIFLDPPKLLSGEFFVLKWDVCNSSSLEDRTLLNHETASANHKISNSFKQASIEVLAFKETSYDDGNVLVARNFQDILSAFQILAESYTCRTIRAGCEANIQGTLSHHEKSKSLSGKAFEFAARIMDYYREEEKRDQEPDAHFLLCGEFAKRLAAKSKVWPTADNQLWQTELLDNAFTPRVGDPFPIEVFQVQRK